MVLHTTHTHTHTHKAGLLDSEAWIECCAACLRARMGSTWTSLVKWTTAHGEQHAFQLAVAGMKDDH